MVNALQRNSFGLSLALHALVVVMWVSVGGSHPPLRERAQMPLAITLVDEPLTPTKVSKAVSAPTSERVVPRQTAPVRTAEGRKPQRVQPQAPVPAQHDREADLAAARAARRQAETDRLGSIATSLGQGLPSGEARPGEMSGDLAGRQLLVRVDPPYPEGARVDGAEGEVVLRVAVGPQGTVTGVRLVARSGDTRLDQAAIAAVSQWRFSPLPQAAPQETQSGTVPIRFHLR